MSVHSIVYTVWDNEISLSTKSIKVNFRENCSKNSKSLIILVIYTFIDQKRKFSMIYG